MNTEHTKHPCETVDASADVMKLAGMILSDCGCSTAISDRLQRRVAGRIQLHMDSVAQQLELERGSLFAESQRKQQLQGQVDALLAAMNVIALGELPDGKYANISTMAYAEEAYKAAQRAPIKDSLTTDRQAEPVARITSAKHYVAVELLENFPNDVPNDTPLYLAQPVARDVLMAALHELRDACSFAVSGDIVVKSADKVMAGVDIAAIADRYAARPPAVAVAVPDVVEQIAQQWDGCMYDSADGCHIDIGQDIRQAGQRLGAAQKGGAA